nr:hypothetical protein [Pseudomonas putida]
MRRELKSHSYTTRLDELWIVGSLDRAHLGHASFHRHNSRICHGHHVIHFCEKCLWSMDIKLNRPWFRRHLQAS